jgi:homoserine dehydrogenase
MTADGLAFSDALSMAQRLGFAEADPALDIGGGDTGHKVAIMASLAYGGYVPFDAIPIEGITAVGAQDIAFARELGYVIKLLGIIHRCDDGTVSVRVHPAMLHNSHILAWVSDEFNAVQITGDGVGDVLLYGKGAGELPTASAVIGDIIDCCRDIRDRSPGRIPHDFYHESHTLSLLPAPRIRARFYLRFSVLDKPGVLAAIAEVFKKTHISIASVMQKEQRSHQFVPVIFITHQTTRDHIDTACAEIETMECVGEPAQKILIEE